MCCPLESEIPEEYESDLYELDGVECNIDDHGHDQRLEAEIMGLVEADVTLNLDKASSAQIESSSLDTL